MSRVLQRQRMGGGLVMNTADRFDAVEGALARIDAKLDRLTAVRIYIVE